MHVADRTLGALSNSNTHTGHRNTHSPLEGVRERERHHLISSDVLFAVANVYCEHGYKHSPTCVHTHTRGSEEGPGQPVVAGDLSDLFGDVDESTDHWRDPVEAQ